MNIKNLFRNTTALISSAILSVSMAVTAFAAVKDYDFDVSEAPVLDPWGSWSITSDHYDHTKITPESEVIITYECEYLTEDTESAPIEFIVQSWTNPDTPMADSTGKVWGRVAPAEYDSTHAVFKYADMVAAYGTDDFVDVDALNIGATEFGKITLKSCTLTNCEENMYIAMTDAERAEAYKNALIIVLAVALFLIITIIAVFLTILKRKSSYAYDASTGEYVKITK